MILNILQLSLPVQHKIALVLLMLPGILIALMLHEVAHGFIAWRLGDPTAKNMGRLSLNPVHHLDLAGTLMLLLIGFGWAKPVPVNTSNFKKPRRDMALTALAGPASNLLLAFVAAFLWALIVKIAPEDAMTEVTFWVVLLYGIEFFISINVGLALFNLLPIPPLDGSNILACLLPPMIAAKYVGLRRYTQFFYYGLILLSVLANRISFFATIEYYLWFPLQWCRSAVETAFYSLASLVFGL